MNQNELFTRNATWMHALVVGAPVSGYGNTLQIADVALAGQPARYIVIVSDAENRFPRAHNSEVGLVEGQQLARAMRDAIRADAGQEEKRAIVAVIGIANRAYGHHEGAYGIHLALVAAADAHVAAHLAGHPIIGLTAGCAISDTLFVRGYQANRLLALDDTDVMVYAMGKAAAARVTLRSVADLEHLTQEIPPMAYDIASFVSPGLLWKLLKMKSADTPDTGDADVMQTVFAAVLADITTNPPCGLESRLDAPLRSASSEIRERLREQWNTQPEGA